MTWTENKTTILRINVTTCSRRVSTGRWLGKNRPEITGWGNQGLTCSRGFDIPTNVSYNFENFHVIDKDLKTTPFKRRHQIFNIKQPNVIALPCDSQCRPALETCDVTRTLCHFFEVKTSDLRSQPFLFKRENKSKYPLELLSVANLKTNFPTNIFG